MMRAIALFCIIIGFMGCTHSINHLTESCQKSVIELSKILIFDKKAKTYHVEKPIEYAKYSNYLFWQMLFAKLDCQVICENENLSIKEAERIFDVRLKYAPLGDRFMHDGKGVMQYSEKEVEGQGVKNFTQDIVFFFENDKKTIKYICFWVELN